jgi:RNA polymerase sigma-70 factor, ECF subfamily
MALLVVLDRLSPAERVAFVLHDVDVRVKRELVERFVAAWRNGDLDELTCILGEDVTLRADGGGQVHAPRKPVQGRRRVAQIISGGAGRLGLSFAQALVNGEYGVLMYDAEHELIGVVGLRFDAGSIVAIDVVANPEKLAHLTG